VITFSCGVGDSGQYEPPHPASPELCNGVDDDNNYVVDDSPIDVGPVPHGANTCQSGMLTLICDAGFEVGVGGCTPIDTLSDGRNCGSLGNDVTVVAHGAGACVNGAGSIATCDQGFGDADLLVSTGCEANLTYDLANCGSVGHAVPASGTLNANWTCTGGAFFITSCVAGTRNEDLLIDNGCEVVNDGDFTGNTQLTAIPAGELSCLDLESATLSGMITTLTDNDWYSVRATGGFQCLNDFGSLYVGGATYDIVSDTGSVVDLTESFLAGAGFYTTGSRVFIHFHSSGVANVLYSLNFHL
jgi:hypothetical protein